MQNTDLEKLNDFLAATPVLIAHVRAPQEGRERTAPTRKGNEIHHALAQEFSRRLNALGNGRTYLVIDHTADDLSGWDEIEAMLTAKHAAITGADDGSRFRLSDNMAHEDFAYFHEAGCDRMEKCNGLPGDVFLIIPNPPDACPQRIYSEFLLADASRIFAKPALSLSDYFRMVLYHEGFGHGTEPEDMLADGGGDVMANKELRADIAAIAGILRDGGSVETARASIHLRNLSSLRQAILHPEGAQLAAVRANGPELETALESLAATPGLRGMDDVALVDVINRTFAPLAIDETGFAKRVHVLEDACRLVREARYGDADTLARLVRKNPEHIASATRFLADCMKAHAFFMKPAQTPRPKPAPHPVMP